MIKPVINSTIFLVRHGESNKNLQKKHGYVNAGLTEKGKREIITISKIFSKINFELNPNIFFSTKSPQAVKSAYIMKQELHYSLTDDERLSPISLGVFSGLTEEESQKKFPVVSNALNRWIQGKGNISEINIPESESIYNFWRRGVNFLSYIRSSSCPVIIVGDRSILILIINCLLKNNIYNNKYRYFKIPTGSLTTFIVDSKVSYVDNNLTTSNIIF